MKSLRIYMLENIHKTSIPEKDMRWFIDLIVKRSNSGSYKLPVSIFRKYHDIIEKSDLYIGFKYPYYRLLKILPPDALYDMYNIVLNER